MDCQEAPGSIKMRDYGSLEARDLPRKTARLGRIAAVSFLAACAIVALVVIHHQVGICGCWTVFLGSKGMGFDGIMRSDTVLFVCAV
jgi:hypothetical protein